MRTIAHISDIHFGRLDVPVAEALVAELVSHKPTLLVVSGDFTQRGRHGQYAAARSYLGRLPAPQLLVPGNHDIPLFDVIRRVFFPLGRYQQYITREMMPEYRDEELYVLGVNSARSFTHKSGWLSDEQLAEIQCRMSAMPDTVLKVLVTHHPFVPPPLEPHADVIRHAERYLPQLGSSGVDLLLAGHLHRSYRADVRAYYRSASRSILSVQAGTTTSTRRRGEANAYNWISLSPGACSISVRSWNGQAFSESAVARYQRVDGQWAAFDAAEGHASSGPVREGAAQDPYGAGSLSAT